MKKIAALVCAIAMSLSFASCNNRSLKKEYSFSDSASVVSSSQSEPSSSFDETASSNGAVSTSAVEKDVSHDYESGTVSVDYNGASLNIPSSWDYDKKGDNDYYYFDGGFIMLQYKKHNYFLSVKDDGFLTGMLDGMKNSIESQGEVYNGPDASYTSIGVNNIDALSIVVSAHLSGTDVHLISTSFVGESSALYSISFTEYFDSKFDHSEDYQHILDSICLIGTPEESLSIADNSADSEGDDGGSDSEYEPTTGEYNALRKADDYLNVMAFSRSGLIEQLEYDGYSHDEAVYAVDNCGANWKKQAVKKAKAYLELMAFSRSRLIEQLEYDGFTHKQAVYGAKKNGY